MRDWRALLDAEDRALLATAATLLGLGVLALVLLAGVLGLCVRIFMLCAGWG